MQASLLSLFYEPRAMKSRLETQKCLNICWEKIDLHPACESCCPPNLQYSLSSSTPSIGVSLSLDHPTYPQCLHSGSSLRFQKWRETSSQPALISQHSPLATKSSDVTGSNIS
uniref:Uncharacterized protein n=1 Tax=Aquila chrysaetos chrysaetos TaxID=223781 RepID=A0A663EME2_AQUCH